MNGRLVYGVGVYEKGRFRSWTGGKQGKITKEYHTWSNMIERCYSSKLQEKQPTYIGCEVSENFKNFQWFAEWCQSQIGFGTEGYQLDKDIVFKGNKLYSENTCFFVPSQINNLIVKSNSRRGEFKIGVHFFKRDNNYRSQCSIEGVNVHLGYFKTEQEAFYAYKKYKENTIQLLVKKYAHNLDDRVIEALNTYTVEIND